MVLGHCPFPWLRMILSCIQSSGFVLFGLFMVCSLGLFLVCSLGLFLVCSWWDTFILIFLIGITMTLPDVHKRIEPSRSHVLQVLLKKEGTPDLSGVPVCQALMISM